MIINLFSGPRNVSTALMYSFSQGKDTLVLDEPWYGYYLSISGADHPGKDEVIRSMETDGVKVYHNILDFEKTSPLIFIKNMCHHFINLDEAYLLNFTNVFLIRDPNDMLPSLALQIQLPTLRDTGLKHQLELYEGLVRSGQAPGVIDAKLLSNNPEDILRKLCAKINIHFEDSMLAWEKGPKPQDGVWAKHWYQKVHESTGFRPYKESGEPFPERLKSLLGQCLPYYLKLREHVIQ